MVERHPALEKVWAAMRKRHAKLIAQPMPVQFLIKLCKLKEREALVATETLKPHDIVRLKTGRQEMVVSKVLDTQTIECTYFDGVRQVTNAISVADVVKVEAPRRSNALRSK